MRPAGRVFALRSLVRYSLHRPLAAICNAHSRRSRKRTYAHPITGEPHTVSVQTIERWYYEARATDDPTASLRRKVRNDSGRFPSIKQPLIDAIASLYKKASDLELSADRRQSASHGTGGQPDRGRALVCDGAALHEVARLGA
jgi:hypothetical protein